MDQASSFLGIDRDLSDANLFLIDNLDASAPSVAMSSAAIDSSVEELRYVQYQSDKEEVYLPAIRQLISKDLSEPYSIYVYRYFLYQWGEFCFMVKTNSSRWSLHAELHNFQALDSSNNLIGVVVCKLEGHRSDTYRGYIAMLAVQEAHRGKGIATKLVCMAIDAMAARNADEVVLETEVTNKPSLKLYERLGFLRSKRLHRYYLNGNSAFRLVLYLKPGAATRGQ
jgi:N-alpha-acetyltransferase 30